jgi:hypothetical protein
MKFLILFFSLQSFFAFASIEKEFKILIDSIQAKNNLCTQQVSNILKKAYRDDEKTPEGQENFKFIKDEQEAMKLMKSLDLNKVTFEENSKVTGFVIKNCSADGNLAYLKQCDYSFELYFYHRALAHAAKSYAWSQKSKIEAIRHIRKYLDTVSTADTDILDKFLAVEVLKRLSDNGFLLEKSKSLVKDLAKEAETISENSQIDFKKSGAGKNCGSAYTSFEKDLALAKRLGIQFQEVLKKITFK